MSGFCVQLVDELMYLFIYLFFYTMMVRRGASEAKRDGGRQ